MIIRDSLQFELKSNFVTEKLTNHDPLKIYKSPQHLFTYLHNTQNYPLSNATLY